MHQNKGNNKAIKIFVIVTTTGLIVGGGITGLCLKRYYAKGLEKYEGRFLANTYINSIDVSEKTPDEVCTLIAGTTNFPECITVTNPDGSPFSINFNDIGYEDNLKASIYSCFKEQDHTKWHDHLKKDTFFNFQAEFTYDEGKLMDILKEKIVDAPDAKKPKNAYIKQDGNKFCIVKEKSGNKIKKSKFEELYNIAAESVANGEYTIDLTGIDCYMKPKVKEKDLTDDLEKLNKVYNTEIILDFDYATETINADIYEDWIIFEEDLTKGYTVDADAVMRYVEDLAVKYDTYKTERTFNSTKRGTVTVPAGEGCYGWWIDQQLTCDLIVDKLEKGESVTTDPIYYQSPNSGFLYMGRESARTSNDDIGNTYCEVDLKSQHFWHYVNGEMVYECDIVSGKPVKYRNTPQGIYKLWLKEKNRVLKDSSPTGDSWETEVTYWNNISTIGIGFHDATWQAKFGGDWYVENGSHGCINMSLKDAKYVFENVEIGTPVVIF